MKGYLVRASIDQAFGEWNAPIDPESGEFVYVPIPEKAGTVLRAGMETDYGPFRAALDAFGAAHPEARPGACRLPAELSDRSTHLDPDFDRLTYGDNGLRRGKGMAELEAGDLVVFYAGMRSVAPAAEKLIYALIGLYRVAEGVRLRDVPASRWAENAHTRKVGQGPDDIIIRAQPRRSGRLRGAIPIGEYRERAYRVRADVLEAWGGLTCRDGYIQRSAVPPAFRDPARFLRWFEAQSPELVSANNPPTEPASKAGGARAPASSAPIILVHLRQPTRKEGESRTDPLYEFGSFGLTGCHRDNLLATTRATGARLGFVQPGPGKMRLVLFTPPVSVIDHGRRREASWSPPDWPLRFSKGVLLVDNEGNTEVPALKAMLSEGLRTSWVARLSSAFRSRTKPLPPKVAAAVARAWERRCQEGGPGARCKKYWDALPRTPSKPDTNRAATRESLLARARNEDATRHAPEAKNRPTRLPPGGRARRPQRSRC